MQEASRAVARLAPLSGPLMPPTRRARAPPVACIVGAPGHCPAAAAPHRIPEGTALGDPQILLRMASVLARRRATRKALEVRPTVVCEPYVHVILSATDAF